MEEAIKRLERKIEERQFMLTEYKEAGIGWSQFQKDIDSLNYAIDILKRKG